MNSIICYFNHKQHGKKKKKKREKKNYEPNFWFNSVPRCFEDIYFWMHENSKTSRNPNLSNITNTEIKGTEINP